MSFDPNADPMSDPMLADVVAKRLLQSADHAWEIEQPPGFDPIEAAERFMKLAQSVQVLLQADCELELWPAIRDATFHGELVLPRTALAEPGSAVIRASNFANLVAILNDEMIVQPDVLARLKRLFVEGGYRFMPSSPLRRDYTGHHRAERPFAKWRDRLFGYV